LPWKKRGKEYEDFKDILTNRLLKVVCKNIPEVEKYIDYSELSTPLSVSNLANYSRGELYGIDHTPSRFRQKWLKPKSEIKNLFLTGQDIMTVGVVSALMSGLITASAITKKNLIKQL